MNLPRLIRTIAPLRRQQIFWRPIRITQKKLYRQLPWLTRPWTNQTLNEPEIPSGHLDRFRTVLAKELTHLHPEPTSISHLVDEIEAGRFTFLNRTLTLSGGEGSASLNGEAVDWNHRYGDHLWNFHLHYFPFVPLVAWYSEQEQRPELFAPVQRLIEDWMLKALPGRSDGWEAYPISVRTVNWIYGYARLAPSYPDRQFLERWRGSIRRQIDFLLWHLEFQHLANHLFRNLRALVIAGVFFENTRWLERGSQLLWREIDEQFLPDGGHFERSPMYHAQTLADVVECVALLRLTGHKEPAGTEALIRRMVDFLVALSYPDGRLALFNDSAHTPETRPLPIISAARQLAGRNSGEFPAAFPSTGYFLWQSADGNEKLIVDAGPPSVSYNAAHAHCDLLSFELQIGGRPWIVDTGVHGYGGDQFRHYCRSTRAHNTLRIDGREQSEIWSTFRLGGAGRAQGFIVEHSENAWEFQGEACHYAHQRLRHQRSLRRDNDGDWTILDRIIGGPFNSVESVLHFHPDLEVKVGREDSFLLGSGAASRQLTLIGGLTAELILARDGCPDGWYFPEFGIALPGKMLIARFTGQPGASFGFRISKP